LGPSRLDTVRSSWRRRHRHQERAEVRLGAADHQRQARRSRAAGTALIFDNQAEKLGVKVGDALTYSAPRRAARTTTIDVRVVAIAKGMACSACGTRSCPSRRCAALYQLRPDATGVVEIMLSRARPQRHRIAARLRTSLEKAGNRIMEPDPHAFWMKFQSVSREDWTGQKLDVTTWEDEISFITWVLQALGGLTFVLITILILIVASAS